MGDVHIFPRDLQLISQNAGDGGADVLAHLGARLTEQYVKGVRGAGSQGANPPGMEAAAAERAPGRAPAEEDELSVRVAVRLRPLLPAEQVGGAQTCIRPARRPNEVVLGKGKGAKRFTFDAAFAEDAPQDRVFDEMALPLVNNVFEGYNATLFAYGQTGSGKTFTMGSSNKTVGFDAEVGMIPRVVRSIFDRLEESDAEADGEAARAPEFLMRASFIEIYNEELKDLLNPSTSPKDISIREDADGSIVVAGVKEQVVSALSVIQNPHTPQQQRQEAQAYCDEFKRSPNAIAWSLELFTEINTGNEFEDAAVKHFALRYEYGYGYKYHDHA